MIFRLEIIFRPVLTLLAKEAWVDAVATELSKKRALP
jgi:hypothetical protein